MTIANAKPDLWATGPLGMSVVNSASSLFHDATSVEMKITAAYTFANAVGAKYVYVPQTFEGFDATQVTTQAGITALTENQLFGNAAIVVNPASFPGANGGAKVAAAAAALPAAGGIVDARGLTGAQIVTGDMLFNVTTEKPIKFLFGPSTWNCQQGNSAYIMSLFGSQIEINGNETTFLLNDGQNQSFLFGSDQTAGVANAAVTNGSAVITLAGSPSRGVTAAVGKCIAINAHTPAGGRDNTTLNGALTDAVGTTVVLTSITGQITSGAGTFYFRVDNEIIGYQTANISGNTITLCTRGAFGSTAVSHLNGATVDRVVYDSYTIKAVAGLSLTLDRVVTLAPTMTAVPTLIGPADCAFTGTLYLDGGRPASDTAANGMAIQVWAAMRLKTAREVVFRNWDHGGVICYQSQYATIDGSFFNIGTPSANLGFAVLCFEGSKYCTIFGDYDRVNQAITLDDRTNSPQIYDNQPIGCVALPRTIRNSGACVRFEGSSRSYALIPFVENWGVDSDPAGSVFSLTAPQWVTAGPGLGNFFEIGYCTPTGQIGSLGAGTQNTFINIRTPLCTVQNLGDATNVIWTIGAISGINYGHLLANPMQFGNRLNVLNLSGTSSTLGPVAPDSSVVSVLQTFNSGSAAVPGRVGTTSNHAFGFLQNNLVRCNVDASGNLVADTTNGGTFQDRLGTAAAVAKHVRIPFQASGLTTTSTSDVSVSSFSLPASALAVNGQAVRLTMRGSAVTQAGVPNIKFGATVIATGTITVGNVYEIDAIVTRTGAATQISVATIDNGTALSVNSRTTPAETLSGAITIDFRGSVTAGGTLNVDYVQVEYMAS